MNDAALCGDAGRPTKRPAVRWLELAAGILLTFVASGNVAIAGEVSGNDLLDWCKKPVPMGAMCVGYIVGASDANLDFFNALGAEHLFCIPNGVTREQTRDVVVKYLNAHPERRHFSASSQVPQALEEAFPCTPRKR
jgi:hypothetical protein